MSGIPPHHSAPLMTEEEVRQYFVQNGGLVRNNDIVTYFRTYLANPSIRDEARAIFKTIVNKLATVKVENGEKYLVLKRQYFQPSLDGNGNNSGLGLPTMPQSPHAPSLGYAPGYGQTPSSIGPPAYHQTQGNYPAASFPQSSQNPQQSFTPFPYQAPPPYISSGAYPHVQQQQAPMPHPQAPTPYHELSKSQPMLYGSHFSLNSSVSTYGDVYAQPSPPSQLQPSQHSFSKSSSSSLYNSPKSQQLGPAGDYDYGLPPAPAMSQNKNAPPRRLSFSSPSSSSSSSSVTSPGGGRMIPPPYRPPPPAPAYLTSPPPTLNVSAGIRASFPNYRSPGFNQHAGSSSRVEPFPAFPYQRSLSVSGISGLPPAPAVVNKGSHSASPSSEHQPFFPQQVGVQSPPPPPVPPRTKRSSSFLEKSTPLGSFSSASTIAMDELGSGTNMNRTNKGSSGSSSETESSTNTNDKENASPPNPNDDYYDGSSVNETEPSNSEAEQKISVKERMQKFNKISSESDLAPKMPNGGVSSRSKRDNGSKHDSGDYDTSSLSSYGCYAQTEPKGREWILKAARSDYAGVNKMAQDNPSLVKRKDINGYTALHWASKLGQVEMVKLLAGTYKSDVNSKSNGGYTPLHLAAQFSRQEVYDILVKVYNADPNIRDHSGKKPMQYLVRQDTAVSVDTFKKLKEKRRSTEQQRERENNSFLRIGSLNVRVKKTTEAFGNFIGKSNSASNIERILNKKWGSTESLPETEIVEKDKEMMPPPSGPNVPTSVSKGKRSKPRKNIQQDTQSSPSQQRKSSFTESPTSRLQEMNSGSDSDTACGFGSGWKGN